MRYDDIVQDGQSVRVPITLMDSDDRPQLTADAARGHRIAAREAYVAGLRDAWRTAGRVKDAAPPEPEPDEPDEPDADTAYEERNRQLQNAWQTNPQAATAIERQLETWRGK